ncbi:protein of unknown function (plasmid) [Cupriavidus neocaledonicus]|uniref:Uncharacterized protein n=1 Tax=Cupriavidus neocaledonicus TaxID=1040979 RepID=A0A375HSG3_9BURK|nr:protein of unknown function [Cupriavidus neocaledonicus]
MTVLTAIRIRNVANQAPEFFEEPKISPALVPVVMSDGWPVDSEDIENAGCERAGNKDTGSGVPPPAQALTHAC